MRIVKLTFIFIFFGMISGSTNAQSPMPCDQIGVDSKLQFLSETDPIEAEYLDTFCFKLRTKNYTDIIGFQITLSFDTSVLGFVSSKTPPGVLAGSLSQNQVYVDDGFINYLFTNFNAEGQDLPDSITIFNLCFQALQDSVDCTAVGFNEYVEFFPSPGIVYLKDGEYCNDTLLLINNKDTLCVKIGEQGMVGIKEETNKADARISIYPNPSSNTLLLNSKMNIQETTIVNMQGQIVQKQRGGRQIDVSKLLSGLYFLMSEDKNGRKHLIKFIKQ